ncbi:TetR/AcrR family transcriptional regulator [Streptomonospora sp. S1-112]|uniref:TetR/AcrR family transcriptional regulator n=1 Tax=Streptomonospora mangrovi TaxID=2883123 RepID=A0A9X3SFI3_9ACTN|nr:TetR/AcrR family transcriptional regulator [Streptomonospora mangrovi]MDA0566007.1 TetR/AcrR family transcriptional regulator [Streptomonospora mangrovi]
MTVEKVHKPVRTSHRGAATRSALLKAAAHVFRTVGFARAGVSEVVEQAGASVGSLYHHFTGKADLYHALYEEFQQRQQDRTHRAVAEARARGENDPTRLMYTAARAYLEGCIEERETTLLFFSGDGPPGFDSKLRERLRQWTDRNVALFRKADEPVDEALLMVVSGAMLLAVTEVIRRDDAEARRLADDITGLLSRLEPRRPAPTD